MQKETDDKINFARVGKKLNPLHFYYENSVCVCKCIWESWLSENKTVHLYD